jgi:hypothetical protein
LGKVKNRYWSGWRLQPLQSIKSTVRTSQRKESPLATS